MCVCVCVCVTGGGGGTRKGVLLSPLLSFDDLWTYDLASNVLAIQCLKRRKHGALRSQKPLRLIRDGEVGESGISISNTYSLHRHLQNDSALRWTAVCAILMFH